MIDLDTTVRTAPGLSLLLLVCLPSSWARAESDAAMLAHYQQMLHEAARTPTLRIEGDQAERLEQASRDLVERMSRTEDAQRRHKLARIQWLFEETRRGGRSLQQRHEAWRRVFGESGHVLHPVGQDPMGSRCVNAIDLRVDQGLRLWADSSAEGRSTQWLRWIAPGKGRHVVVARSALGDPALTAFSHCADISSSPLAANDDAFGLDAELGIDAHYAGQVFQLRLDYHGNAGPVDLLSTSATSISGRVTRASDGSGVPNVSVDVTDDTFGYYWGSASTSLDGSYQIDIWSLSEPISLFARTRQWYYAPSDLVQEAWENAPCVLPDTSSVDTCDSPTALRLSPGENRAGIDFELSPGATIHGRVLDDATGVGVAGVEVGIGFGDFELRRMTTDAAGRYIARGLAAGSYRMWAVGVEHASEAYDGFECDDWWDCRWTTATPVPLTDSGSTRVDFSLEPRSYIDFQVSVGGQPYLGWSTPVVHIRYANGLAVPMTVEWQGQGQGTFRVGPVEEGVYRLDAHVPNVTFRQLYGGVDCASDCSAEAPQGTSIAITGPGSRPEIAMDLRRLPRLEGRITDGSSGTAPLPGAFVGLYMANSSNTIAIRGTDSDGYYRFEAIPPGEFRVLASAVAYVDEMWPDVPCEQTAGGLTACPGAQLLQVGLATGDQTVDFALSPSPAVHGRILSDGQPVPPSQFGFRGLLINDQLQSSYYTNVLVDTVAGTYRIVDFAPGNYFIAATLEEHYPRIYPDINCNVALFPYDRLSACDWQNAQRFEAGVHDLNIDFDMTRWGLRVAVKDLAGAPLAGVGIDLWNDAGLPLRSAVTGADGTAVLTPGTSQVQQARLSTDNYGGYIDEVYDDLPCPMGTSVFRGGCTLDGAAVLEFGDPEPDGPSIEIRLGDGMRIFYGGFE